MNTIYNFQPNSVIEIKESVSYRCTHWNDKDKNNNCSFASSGSSFNHRVAGVVKYKGELHITFDGTSSDKVSSSQLFMVSESELIRVGLVKKKFEPLNYSELKVGQQLRFLGEAACNNSKYTSAKHFSITNAKCIANEVYTIQELAKLDDTPIRLNNSKWWHPLDVFELVEEEVKTMNNKEDFTVEGSKALKKALVEELKELGFIESTTIYTNHLKPSKMTHKGVTSAGASYSKHFILPKQYNEAKQAFIDFFKEEEKLEVDKWYISEDKTILIKFNGKYHKDERSDKHPYGSIVISDSQGYQENDWCAASHNFKLATTKEVEAALSNEAIKRGLTKGVKYSPPGNKPADIRTISGDYEYNPNWLTGVDCLADGCYVIFKGDTMEWATAITTPNITVNGYTAKFYDTYVEFGCAKFGMKVFEEAMIFINTISKFSTYSGASTNRSVTSIKLGKGEFTIKQIEEINNYYQNK